MVLNYIQASSTQGKSIVFALAQGLKWYPGIWTKHIKSKTELHQTVVDRCLKSLTQKQLVKVVKSVKYPTRKIYMLANLEPSVELTGGPWYTDNELDLEFIKALTQSCLSFIRGRVRVFLPLLYVVIFISAVADFSKATPRRTGGRSATVRPQCCSSVP